MSSLIVEERRELSETLRVCKKCLDLIVLLGYTAFTFIIPRPIFKSIAQCDICKTNDSDFLIIPIRKGISICSSCFESFISISPKHKWLVWQKKEAKNLKCVFCDRPAKYVIIPPKALLKA